MAKTSIKAPDTLSKEEKEQFAELCREFSDLGIDLVRYRRAIITLAKDYALEEHLEEDIVRNGGNVVYEVKGSSTSPFKEHPSAKLLQIVRNRIMASLKGFGLLPTAKTVKQNKPQEKSAFASIGK